MHAAAFRIRRTRPRAVDDRLDAGRFRQEWNGSVCLFVCDAQAKVIGSLMQELRNQIICDDCVSLLRQVEEPFADLIFADPPFNIGYAYDKYHDKKASDRYITWTTDWIAACAAVLKPHGSFYIAIGDDYAANIKLIADAQGLVLRNWIIWHYSFGQQTKNKFARAHTHIFYFTKNKKDFTFNDEMVRVISDRQKKYADKRANPAGKMPDDVWDEYPRVCGTFIERTGFPCQMPESLLARIIRVSSNEGDWVLDPFCGSGTTAAVAHKLGRVYTTIDLSEQYVEAAKTRIAASEGLSSTGVPPVSTTGILPMEQLGIAKRHGARLPHWTQIGATYAVTFRLADSLPAAVVESWRREREGIEQRARDQNRELTLPERRELQDLYAQKVDSILNNGRGACYLKDERVAGAVQDALRHFHGDHYELIAWAVMPNHVHVVVRPLGDHQLPDILHSWKSFTAKQANDILNRQSPRRTPRR